MTWIKKTFFLSLLVFGISALFWGVYNLSFKKPAANQNGPGNQASSNQAVAPKNIDDSEIAAITDEAVISPVLGSAGNTIKYYSAATGKAYQIDLSGNSKTTIGEKELVGLTDAFWSPDKAKVITKFGVPGQSKFYYYNYDTNNAVSLKGNIDQVAWQSSSNKIFYKYFNSQNKTRTLSISDPDGSNWKDLADVSFRDIAISQVPQSGLVSFWNKPDSFSATNLDVMPLTGGDTKTILKDLYGADYLWNNEGTVVLMSYADSKGGHKIQLATANSNGGEFKNLGIPTLVSKCIWSKNDKTIYYALPGSIPDSAVMPNDYNAGKFQTTDTFWKIDAATGEKTRLINLDKMTGKFDASDLFLNNDESYLFFVNKIDGKLYRIKL